MVFTNLKDEINVLKNSLMKKTDETERKIEESVPKIEEVEDEPVPIDQQKTQLAVTKTVNKQDNEFLTFEHEEEQKPQKKINYS